MASVPSAHAKHSVFIGFGVVPSAQTLHVTLPFRFVCALLAHGEHTVLPSFDAYSPTPQSIQSVNAVRDVRPEYLPAGHSTQDEAPITFEYVPIAHVVHTELPDSEYVPALQATQFEYAPPTQLAHVTVFEYVPAAHNVHASSLLFTFAVPGSQGKHLFSYVLLYDPALHIHTLFTAMEFTA